MGTQGCSRGEDACVSNGTNVVGWMGARFYADMFNGLTWSRGLIANALSHDEVNATMLFIAFLYVLAPILVWDLAATSSECDLLIKDLNDKRLANPCTATHTKSDVEDGLNKLNKNQVSWFIRCCSGQGHCPCCQTVRHRRTCSPRFSLFVTCTTIFTAARSDPTRSRK